MKLEDFISSNNYGNNRFANRLGGYKLLGDSRVNPKLQILTPKRAPLSAEPQALTDCVRLYLFGYRELDLPKFVKHGKGHRHGAIAHDHHIGLVCFIENRVEKESLFGLLHVGLSEIPKLMHLAQLCGQSEFGFSHRLLPTDLDLDEKLEYKDDDEEEDSVPGSIFSLRSSRLSPRAEHDIVCNLQNDPTAIAAWTYLGRVEGKLSTIFISVKNEPSSITTEQYRAVTSLVRLIYTVEYGVDFYPFCAVIEELPKVMKILTTIPSSLLKEWFDQYINELLLHEMAEIRTIAKYYVDAEASKGLV